MHPKAELNYEQIIQRKEHEELYIDLSNFVHPEFFWDGQVKVFNHLYL